MPSLKEKPLNQLLTGLTQLDDSRKFLDASISGISLHAGSVCSGNIFVAIPGNKFDGHDFIPEAVKMELQQLSPMEEILVNYPYLRSG